MKNQIQRNIPTLVLALAIVFSVIYYLLVYIPANEKRVWSGGVRQLNTIARNSGELFHAYNDAIIAARGDSSFLDESLIKAPATERDGIIELSNSFYIVFPGNFASPQRIRIIDKRRSRNTPGHLMKNFQDFVNSVEDFSFFEDLIIINASPRSSIAKGRVLNQSRLNISEYAIPDSLLTAGVKIYKTEVPPNHYYAFQRRIDLKGIQLHIIGLISKDTFDKRTRQVDPTITIFFLLGVFLLILSWPVLKLLLITKHERLSTTDVQLTNYAIIMGAAFLTMLVGGAYVFLIAQPSATDARLRDLSADIFKKFHEEVKERLDELDEEDLFRDVDPDSYKGKKEFAFNYNEIFSVEPDSGVVSKLLTESTNHKFDSFKRGSVDVKTRPYYAKLKEPAKNRKFNTYYIQSIKSRATGIQECAISIPYMNIDTIEIRVITSHLPSVINPILPHNYGFVIFHRNGAVQFHSDSRKVINENFLEECDNDSKLQSFIENNSNGYLNLDYGDQRSRVYFQPLNIGDWYIVTFYGKNNADTFASSTLSFSLASFAGILLYIILLHQLFRLDAQRFKVIKGRKFFYQWLNPINIPQGKLKFLILFVIAVAFLDCLWWIYGESVTGTFLLSLLTISITYLVVYHRLRTRAGSHSSRFEPILSIFIFAWSVLLLINGVVRKDGLAVGLLAAAVLLLAAGLFWKAQTSFAKENDVDYISSAGNFKRYRWLLLSLLLVLAVFPSLTFFKDHLNHEKIVRTRKALITEIRQLHPTTLEDIISIKNANIKHINYDAANLSELDRPPVESGKTKPYFAPPDTWFYDRTINYFGRDELQHRGLVLAFDLSNWNFTHNSDLVYAKRPSPNFDSNERPEKVAYASLKMPDFSVGQATLKDSIVLVVMVLLMIIGMSRIIFEIIRRIFYLPLYCRLKQQGETLGEVLPVSEGESNSEKHIVIHAFDDDDGCGQLLERMVAHESEMRKRRPQGIDSLNTDDELKTAILEQQTFTTERYFFYYFKKAWDNLSDDAKYFLYDLAEDGIVNQYDTKVIYELRRKRFIKLLPLEIAHPALAHFIMEGANVEYVREMKAKAGADGRWNHFKIPFGLLIIAILGFISMVEEGLFARISTLLASIGFILPGLIEVVSSWPKLWPGRKG